MKKLLVLCSTLCLVILFAFQNKENDTKLIASYYKEGIQKLKDRIQSLIVLSGAQKPDKIKLQTSFIETRTAYKEIEFLAAYFHAGYASQINSPPLPKVDLSNAQYILLPPSGLQIIEELLYEDSLNYSLILQHLRKTETLVLALEKALEDEPELAAQQVYEAIHKGIIRCFILGISGFDVPASGRAISETQISLEALYQVLNFYSESIDQKDLALFNSRILKAIKYQKNHPHFQNFNRFEFLRDYANPTLEAFVTLGQNWKRINLEKCIENNSSLNPYSKNLFAQDFLNPLAFSSDSKDTLSEARVKLGQYLFFDPILSYQNKRSCASCHKPELAFTDGRAKSLALDSTETLGRNAPSVLNSAFQNAQFWDMREGFLEDQIDHVLSNGKEFHSNYASLISKLNTSSEYDSLFAVAFGKQEQNIDIRRFNLALADYLRSLSSFNSPFDQMIRGEIRAEKNIIKGFNIFMGKALCSTCHFPPSFAGLVPPDYNEIESEVIGVPANSDLDHPEQDKDLGRYYFQSTPVFKGAFKTPGIRNLAKTGPYMHNGVFKDLETILNFYNRGGGAGLGLDIPNQTLPFDSLSLNSKEMNQVIAFLNSLNEKQKYFAPKRLPVMDKWEDNQRRIGGDY